MNSRSILQESDEEDVVRATLQQLEDAQASQDGEGEGEGLDDEVNNEGNDGDGGEDEEEEGNGEELQDSSEEEEEGQNEYDLNDKFLVGDEDEEEEDEEEEVSEEEKKRRRRKRRKEAQLDEEDYELIGLRPPRQTEQRKRIRKLADAGQRTTAERLKEDLFGPEDEGLEDEDEDDMATAAPRHEQRQDREMDDEFEEEDEFADFLDYDDEGGAPGEGRRRRPRQGLPPGVSSAALAEAQEIFGDVSDLLEEYGQRRRPAEEEDVEDEADLMEDEDDEAAELRQRALEERRQQRAMRKVTEAVEPEVMARAMLRPEDDVIRATDLPEREQLRPLIALGSAEHSHRACAEWIHEHLVGALSTEKRLETELVLLGMREVDGPPDGRQEWAERALKGGIRQLPRGERAVRDRRSGKAYRAWLKDEEAQEKLKESITNVLGEMFDKHAEVPFMAMYRKQVAGDLLCCRKGDVPDTTTSEESRRRHEKRQPDMPVGVVQARHRRIRRWDVLWYVHSLALKWRALARRKEIREKAYTDALERAPTQAAQLAIDALIEMLRKATNNEEVADVDAKYKLRASELAEDVAALSIDERALLRRRPKKTSAYETLKKAGLEPVVREMVISAEELGENLDIGYRKHDREDPKIMPEEFAADHLVPGSAFDKPEAVLHGARQMAISEMAAEPEVRKFVRNKFMAEAVISTEPTAQGESILDAFHPYGKVKRLRRKPVNEFDGDDDFLRILQAEKENLITVKIEVPEEVLDQQLIKPLGDYYLSTGTSIQASAWNKQREAILVDALRQRLLPAFALELRTRMAADARHTALHGVADKLWDYASRRPLQVVTPDDDEEVEHKRIVAVCWGPGDPATTFVLLDDAGQLIDTMFAGSLSGPIRRSRDGLFFDTSKARDAERIKDFILKHSPHVLLVGATNMHCRQLHDDLNKVRDHILEHYPQFLTRSETGDVDITYGDETLAALWQTSAAAQAEMGDQPPLVRRAVALARCALDPLAVLASLCGPSGEILGANLHPLQDVLPKQELLAVAERICITATNQVGVDLNRVALNTWQAAPLQFVAGLGPRKAQALLRAVQRVQSVESRFALWEELGLLGRNVFRNCAGFLRITPQDMNKEETPALDDSRVHPSFYDTATCLAQLAVKPSSDLDPKDTRAVDRAMRSPHSVEALDLHDVQQRYQGVSHLDKPLVVLRDICFELVQPYGELRLEAKRLVEEEVFWLLTGESPETLKEGRLVTATVMSAGRDDARVRLTDFGDLEGIVKRGDVSSKNRDISPADRMQRGDTISARIKAVAPSSWVVELTTASQDLMNDAEWEEKYCGGDEYYHVLTEAEKGMKKIAEAKAQRQRQIIHRPIRHPYFKNVNTLQATKLLQDADVGEYLLRPSTRGTSSITLTIKVHSSGVYMHTEFHEGKKEAGVGAHLRLGRPLSVTLLGGKKEEYEDLDEVCARFADPFVSNLKQVLGHRKYKEGRWDGEGGLEERLRQEKRRTPQGAVYLLGCKQDAPGTFYLAFITNVNPHREYFTVQPDGFYFRSEVRSKVDTVIGLFKQNPNHNRDGGHAAPRAADLPGPPLPPGYWGAQPAPVQGGWPAVHPQQQPQSGYGQQPWPAAAAGYPMQPTPQQTYRAYSR
ncbi:Transcription elongation factor SPT6 [Coccomyxa sp. Obi]|nr:Transcription elongation factor SPT6 [Coccomyxa sp. Obi]